MPSSPAICLFSKPEDANVMTCRSRWLSATVPQAKLSVFLNLFERVLTAEQGLSNCQQRLSSSDFRQASIAPALTSSTTMVKLTSSVTQMKVAGSKLANFRRRLPGSKSHLEISITKQRGRSDAKSSGSRIQRCQAYDVPIGFIDDLFPVGQVSRDIYRWRTYVGVGTRADCQRANTGSCWTATDELVVSALYPPTNRSRNGLSPKRRMNARGYLEMADLRDAKGCCSCSG